ncbi:thioredoxin domain-containing protein [Candidatus Gracilibacteria bacterium]|nr:thioredoxin domain-containing protein [Candidatus Gracilibacteria bacterium]
MSYVAQEKSLPYIRPIGPDERYRWTNSSKYTLVIYESLDCKSCRKLNIEILKNIAQYKGKFNLAYRSAPLVDLEPLVAEKSLIAECVYSNDGNKVFFDFIDSLYVNYQVFQKDNNWAMDLAKKVMTHPDMLDACLADPIKKQKIADDIKNSIADGIKFTPSVVIFYDGKLVGRYASGFYGTMRIINYLSTFEDNADQFWSDELFNKIQKGNIK